MKNLLTQWGTEEENRKIVDIVGRKVVDKVVDRKVVDKKPLSPIGKLRKKIKRLVISC